MADSDKCSQALAVGQRNDCDMAESILAALVDPAELRGQD